MTSTTMLTTDACCHGFGPSSRRSTIVVGRPEEKGDEEGRQNVARRIKIDRSFRLTGIDPKVRTTKDERIVTTTSQDAEMAGDAPDVSYASTLAVASKPLDRRGKLVDSTKVHKHKWCKDNEPSIPNRGDTSSEEAGRRRTRPDRGGRPHVRAEPIRSKPLQRSKPERGAAPSSSRP